MDDETNPGCIAAVIVVIMLIAWSAFTQNYSTVNRRATPVPPTPVPTPTWAGPSPEDCKKETDEELADLCWEVIIEHDEEMSRREDFYDSLHDGYDPSDFADDPFEEELWDAVEP